MVTHDPLRTVSDKVGEIVKMLCMFRRAPKTEEANKVIGVVGNKDEKWQRLSIAIDSGACESVINPADVPSVDLIETEDSKNENDFQSATGEPIPNLGGLSITMLMRERTMKGMTFQGAPVSKPLGSVKRICSAGHFVLFDEEASFICNKSTGEINYLREEEGNYMLDVCIPPRMSRGFQRQRP